MMKSLRYLCTLLLLTILGVGGVKAEEYTLTISGSDFNAKSYAENNNTKTSTAKSTTSEKTYDVKWTSNQVMLNSGAMQWQKSSGCIYNKTDLGTIKSVTVTSSAGSFTTYYGSSIQPSSTVVGGGFFQIKVGSATGKSSKVEIVFEIVESGVAVDPNVRFEKDNIEAYIGQSLTNALDKPNNLTVNYSSSNENVAIVDNNGQVSCRGEGNTEISAEWDAVEGVYNSGVVTYNLRVKDPQKFKTFTFTPTEQTAGTLENAPTGVTAEFNNTYPDNEQLTSGNEMTLTIKGIPSTYKVTGIFLNVRNNKSSGKGVAVATLGSSELGTMAIEGLGNVYSEQKMSIDQSQSLATGDLVIKISCSVNSVFCNRFNIEYELPEGFEVIATPTFSVPEGTYFEAQTVTLTCATEGAAIYYTLDGSDPTSESTPYTGAISISETKTLKAIAIKGDDASAIATAEYKIVVTKGKGTEENPFTVADARNILKEGLAPTDVYVTGIVSGIVEAYNLKFGNISYNISDDGATESDQLQAYRGKGKNGADFTSDADIQVKDVVVLKGNLIDYNGTYELAADNQLVSLVRPEKAEPNLTYANAAVSAVRGETFTAPVLTNPNNLTVVYSSSDKTVATVDSESGEVTLLKAGETTITASFAGNADYKEGSASYTLTVTVRSHTATFFVNGQQQGEPATVAEDEAITFPTVAEELYGKKFVGWTTKAIDGETDDEPATLVNAATMGNADVKYYAVFANVTAGSAISTEDELTLATTGVSGNNYAEWSGKTATSNAVYAGQSAGGNESIQLRSDKSNSGVITTTSGGRLKKVAVVWNDETTAGRTLNVYGSNTTYTAATDLYDTSKQGSLLGTIVKGTSTELTIDGDYAYVGLRSASGAMYLTSISVTWENGTPDTYSDYCTTVVKPVAKIANKGYATLQEAVDAAEEDATIDIVDDFTLTTVTTSPSNKYNVNINKSVTINGNNHVITASEGKRGIVLEGEGLDVTIKDLTIKSNKAEACLWIASNLTCTLDNTVLDGTNGKSYNQPLTIGSIDAEGRVTLNVTNGSVIKTNDAGTAHYAIIVSHPADIKVTDSKLIGWANVYLKPAAEGSTVKIEKSEMKSKGLSGNSNNFSTITTECGNNVIEVKDTKITSAAVAGTYMSLLTLGGEGNVVKLLGETTYETNSKEWGAITHNWGALFNNKLYLDDTTKEGLAEYFDGSHQETVDPADETGLYPVSFVPEVYYYWLNNDGSRSGGYYNFYAPFEGPDPVLMDGEFVELMSNIKFTKDVTYIEEVSFGDPIFKGGTFTLTFGEYDIDLNGYKFPLPTGVTVLTDKQTDIFSATEAGYKIVESTTEEGYSYTAEQIQLSAPIIFHDAGEYESELQIAMAGEGTIMYTLNDGEAQTYSAPFTITEDATIKAWAVKDGVASDVTEPKTFTIKEKAKSAKVDDGYYTIQNNEGKYVNVAGRKTVTLVSDTKSAGTVIRVKADEDGVKVLRSQAVDLPRYAERAMSYVPEIVKEVVKKLAANVNDPIIGEQGADLILDKFNKEFDYHLYLEGENNTYRIYGRTPSMKPVVDFYAENKELVDSRLPKVEDFVKEVLQKIVDKVHRGQSVVDMFKVKTVWKNMGGTLTDPDVDQAKFFEEVLTSEENVWSFAYQTGMLYWDKVESYLNDSISELGDYGKYIEKIPRIRPNFKYYIVPSASGVDIISEGNSEIKNASTAWKLAKRDGFDVTFDATLSKNNGKEMYKTLYVDFAYELPENVKALKVESVSDAGVAVTKEITGVVPAQTPVLLMSTDVENLTKTLALSTEVGTAVTDNQLVGADYLINKYEINTPQVESIFTLLANLSQSLADEYSYLKRRNAGTVNNKYFFGLTEDDLNLCTYKNEKNEDDCVVRSLSMGDEKLGFYNNWEAKANEAFLVSEKFNPVKLTLVGDVNRDGKISIADVNALVEIVLGTVTEENNPNNYDFKAAHVNADEVITIADVTALVNMIIK